MKTAVLCFFLSLFLVPMSIYAGHTVNTEDSHAGIVSFEDMMTAKSASSTDKQLLKNEKKQYRAEKRIVSLTKLIQKKVAKHKASPGSGTKTLSILSVIGGVGGFLFLFIPYIGFLGLLMAIAGFVLGFVAMKNEGSNAMNILGIVFGGLTILLFLFALIVVVAWLSAI